MKTIKQSIGKFVFDANKTFPIICFDTLSISKVNFIVLKM